MNRHIKALHVRNINLKSDVIRYLLTDFVNLSEFTLSFAEAEGGVVGGGHSNIQTGRNASSIKRREVG